MTVEQVRLVAGLVRAAGACSRRREARESALSARDAGGDGDGNDAGSATTETFSLSGLAWESRGRAFIASDAVRGWGEVETLSAVETNDISECFDEDRRRSPPLGRDALAVALSGSSCAGLAGRGFCAKASSSVAQTLTSQI